MIKFSLPIYFEDSKGRGKNKKIKLVLLSWNWFMIQHRFKQAAFKKKYHEIVIKALLKDIKQIKSKYSVTYTYYYRNGASDLPNVVSLVSKFLNDSLSELGIITDDNVKYLKEEHSYVGELDKENPRIEIIIKEIE